MEEINQKIVDFLTKKYDLETIILFGSYARNTQNTESDIDIAIRSKNSINIEKNKIIDIETCKKMKNMIGFRNIVVQDYKKLMINLKRG